MIGYILVEVSARHIHLSRKDLEILFGSGYRLTKRKDLSQPGQYVCEEKVEVIGDRGELSLSVLGPTREETQVELSLTDARTLGIQAPIRESGDIRESGACVIRGPQGILRLREGVIAAKRHIHMTPTEARQVGVRDREEVSVQVRSDKRAMIFKDVVVRISEKYSAAMHIDTDEANAAGITGTVYGSILKTETNRRAMEG